ncbi:MAG TPA: hypothetical protein VN841_03930 [Bryobacteraceae bacterium]|nr:hypothetical protein [Bryobacteraceae bacterium]
MFRIQRLKLLYALAGLLFAGYCTAELLTAHIANHTPISSGTLYCLLLFVSVPAFGYILLFRLFPSAARFLRR